MLNFDCPCPLFNRRCEAFFKLSITSSKFGLAFGLVSIQFLVIYKRLRHSLTTNCSLLSYLVEFRDNNILIIIIANTLTATFSHFASQKFRAFQKCFPECPLQINPCLLCQCIQNQTITIDICFIGRFPSKIANFRWYRSITLLQQ